MKRLEFKSLHRERTEGGTYVHAMVRVPTAEATLLAELTVEAKDPSKLPVAADELRDWVREQLVHAFGGGATRSA